MAIEAVTFDLWQTLLIDNRELGRDRMKVRLDGALDVLRDAGEHFSEEDVREAYRQCYRTCHDIRAQERDVSFMEQIEIFIQHIDSALKDRLTDNAVERIAAIYADSLFHYPPPPHPDANRVLGSVKEMGYRIGLISNTGMTPGTTFRAYMARLGLLGCFDVLIFSDEVLLAKPNKEVFTQTTRLLGSSPERTIHVGDHLLNDILGAKQVGMKTIWIETHDERRAEVDVQPDVTVPSLGQVDGAIRRLASAE